MLKADMPKFQVAAEVPSFVCKAAELFTADLVLRAYELMEMRQKKTVQKLDVLDAVAADEVFDFLIDLMPQDHVVKSKFGEGEMGDNRVLNMESNQVLAMTESQAEARKLTALALLSNHQVQENVGVKRKFSEDENDIEEAEESEHDDEEEENA